MERINLNIPKASRRQLLSLAEELGQSEAQTARELLLDALDGARRRRFRERVAEAMTPQRRQRQLEVLQAFERLDG